MGKYKSDKKSCQVRNVSNNDWFFRFPYEVIASLYICIVPFSISSPLFSFPLRVPNNIYYEGAADLTNHKGHFPFISHVTFRNMCDHIIDQTTTWFDPSKVQRGDTIYLNVWYLNWFAKEIHDRIEHPYILITGDVGNWIPDTVLQRLLYDPKLAAWFCRNMIFSYHPKLFQIPMGQDLTLFGFGDAETKQLIGFTQNLPPKKYWLYMNHYPREHGGRQDIVKHFEHKPYCLSKNHSDQPFIPTSYEQYIHELSASYFTISPLGLETDCVRTWEAIVLGSIPIVEHTFLDPSYEDLPVLIVDDWEEIDLLFLQKKYLELKDKNREQAYFPYWQDKILKAQEQIIAGENRFSHIEATTFEKKDLFEICELLSGYESLIYKGFLSSIRPLQLAKHCPSLQSILIYDPWLEKETFDKFHLFFEDFSYLENRWKIYAMGKEEIKFISPKQVPLKESSFFVFEQTSLSEFSEDFLHPPALFLDLSYFRHSLLSDFSKDFRNLPRNTHLLQRDLSDLYRELPLFALFCGNMAQDPYVKKGLTNFCKENQCDIQFKGSFWFLIKFP